MQRNTLITLSDNKIGIDNNADNRADFYTASVLSATDYYAFGMSMKERSWQSEKYRYGFNGKENDTDWDVQDYGFRIYKPELGKFLSVDPITQSYPELTPYQFASNRPIDGVDLDGKEWEGIRVIAPDLWSGLIKWWKAPADPKMAEAAEFISANEGLNITIKTNGDMVMSSIAVGMKQRVEGIPSGNRINTRGLYKKNAPKSIKNSLSPIKSDATNESYQQENKIILSSDRPIISGTYTYMAHPKMYDAHGHGSIDKLDGMNVEQTISTLKGLGAGQNKYKVWNIMACDISKGNFLSEIAQKTGKYTTGPTQEFYIKDETSEIIFSALGTWNIYNPAGKLIKEISYKEFRTVDDLMKLIQKYTGTK